MAEDHAAQHRTMASLLFNEAWAGLERPDREPGDERIMLAAALGSWYHWRQVGTPREFAVSDWQVARVFAVLGDARRAAEFAESSRRWCAEHGLGPFLTGYAYEALARAAIAGGDLSLARRHLASATTRAGKITDTDDRALLDADLGELDAYVVA
ncbi:MAG: hypothetical protein OEM66_03120 [Acidimicrobiia bacterium]|nr:hypothetical protein [Acidimicrobiia bacterium]